MPAGEVGEVGPLTAAPEPAVPVTRDQIVRGERQQDVADRCAVLRRTALTVVPRSAPGITLDAYLAKMGTRLPKAKGWDPAASTGWCAMAIKLDLEARGELKRVNDKPPQRLVRA